MAAVQGARSGNIEGKRKIDELRSLTDELLRRAEIKAASSNEQSKLQQATIKVIKRIKTALEENEN